MTVHDLHADVHYRSLCRACIAAEIEYEYLADVVATSPDPDVVRLALIIQGELLTGEA